MRTTLFAFILMAAALAWFAPPALAQNDGVRVRAGFTSASAYIGQDVRYSIVVEGSSEATQPVIDAVRGLDIRFSGGQESSTSFTQIINGRRTQTVNRSYTFQWAVTSASPGTFTIPPTEVTVQGVRYTTPPSSVRFIEPPTTEDMLLDVSLERTSAFVGEPVRVTIDWYLAKTPQGWDFALAGLGDAFDLASPATINDTTGEQTTIPFLGRDVRVRQARIVSGGIPYTRVRIEQMLVPRRTGTLTIDPISVSAELVMREGFIRNVTEFYGAKAAPVTLDVRELPDAGRPRNFTGLIGEYDVRASASTSRANVGDPIEVTLSVGGPIVEAVRAPALHLQRDLAERFRVPDDLGLSQIENGRKVWRFTLRPESDGVTAIPPIELPYFDPSCGAYSLASSAPIPLEVTSAREVTLSDAQGGRLDASPIELEDSGAGLAYIATGEQTLRDQRFVLREAILSPASLAIAGGSLGFWAFGLVFATVKRRGAGSREAAERRRALATARRELADATTPADVSRAVYAYFGRKLGRAPSGLTPDECAASAPAEDNEIRGLLGTCDASAYAGGGASDAASLAARATQLLTTIDPAWRAN